MCWGCIPSLASAPFSPTFAVRPWKRIERTKNWGRENRWRNGVKNSELKLKQVKKTWKTVVKLGFCVSRMWVFLKKKTWCNNHSQSTVVYSVACQPSGVASCLTTSRMAATNSPIDTELMGALDQQKKQKHPHETWVFIPVSLGFRTLNCFPRSNLPFTYFVHSSFTHLFWDPNWRGQRTSHVGPSDLEKLDEELRSPSFNVKCDLLSLCFTPPKRFPSLNSF